jgi:hypothetical protein
MFCYKYDSHELQFKLFDCLHFYLLVTDDNCVDQSCFLLFGLRNTNRYLPKIVQIFYRNSMSERKTAVDFETQTFKGF